MSESVSINVMEKEFPVSLSEKDGKTFAKTHIDNFGEVTVGDFGGGHDGALKNLRARVSNIVGTLREDEAREARRNPPSAEGAEASAKG
jgi:hypothetical protein